MGERLLPQSVLLTASPGCPVPPCVSVHTGELTSGPQQDHGWGPRVGWGWGDFQSVLLQVPPWLSCCGSCHICSGLFRRCWGSPGLALQVWLWGAVLCRRASPALPSPRTAGSLTHSLPLGAVCCWAGAEAGVTDGATAWEV